MRKTLKILTFGLFMIFFSCKQMDEKNSEVMVVTDTLKPKINKKENERLERRKKIEKQNKIDSLNLDKFLKSAIKIAEQNIHLNKFKDEYFETMLDSSYQVKVNISSDFYFSNKNPHLIIKRNTPNSVYIDVFSKKNNRFYKVLSHEQWNMTYRNDTIQDINGDGLKDFVVNWYGSTGCCLKAFSDVYILRLDKKHFSSNFEFINPTFYPKEKIIRGICYGHPSETEIYKYRWNGETIDTLEYVSYEKNDKGVKTGKIIVSNKRPHNKQFKILKRLSSVPKEYRVIEGYDWFTGKGY